MYSTLISVSLLIALLVFLAGWSLSKKQDFHISSSAPFECGLTTVVQSFKPVSLRFFLLSVVFLIFDVELLLMYPIFLELIKLLNNEGLMVLISFLIIITWGLMWEWNRQQLEWNK